MKQAKPFVGAVIRFKLSDPSRKKELFKMIDVFMEKVAAAEDGCQSYHFFEDMEMPGWYAVIGRWENEEALETHMASPYFRESVPKIGEILQGFAIHIYRALH